MNNNEFILDVANIDQTVHVCNVFKDDFKPTDALPLIIYNAVHDEWKDVLQDLRIKVNNQEITPFYFVVVSDLNWEQDMSPWAIAPLFKREPPCTGGADAYLESLTQKIIPNVLEHLPGEVSEINITGYSLGGLFAYYSGFKCNIFTGIGCISGSLWYPNLMEFVQNNSMQDEVLKVYFSLGDKESNTKHKVLGTVLNATENIVKSCQEIGKKTVFILNPGNHYEDETRRIVSGITWLLCN